MLKETELRRGWQTDRGMAQWWVEPIAPRIVVNLPKELADLPGPVAKLLEDAWYCGFNQGLTAGDIISAQTIATLRERTLSQ